MNEHNVIALATMAAVLLMFGASYRARRIPARKTLLFVAAWAAIIAISYLAFESMQ
jgi:hypothetical protein